MGKIISLKSSKRKQIPKGLIIAAAIVVLLVVAILLYKPISKYFSKSNNSEQDSQTATQDFETFFISEKVSPDLQKLLQKELRELIDTDIKATSDISKADIQITAGFIEERQLELEQNPNSEKNPPDNQVDDRADNHAEDQANDQTGDQRSIQANDQTGDQAINYYQIWIVTRPWSSLGTTKPTQITSHTEKINLDNNRIINSLEKILGQDYEVELKNTNSTAQNDTQNSSNLQIQTIDEVDGTRIAVSINDIDPFAKETWEQINYPLIWNVRIESKNSDLIEKFSEKLEKENSEIAKYLAKRDFHPDLPKGEEITTVIKTGTSVIGGPGWYLCERTHGIQHPITEVKDFLLDADFTVISNESSFVSGCSQAAGTTSFCGKPNYFDNLIQTDIDLISLTGNHMADYGREAFSQALDLYKENDIKYFAGGKNTQQAWTPRYIQTSAGTIAFLGYNKMGPTYVLATENSTGSAYYDKAQLEKSINQAKKEADIIWVDTHLWPEYGTTPTSEQVNLSNEAIDLGADIVTGVSSHEIQAMDFYENKPIFYGLGNFWFDQMLWENTRLGIVLKVTLYQNTIKDIDIHPTRMYDYCQVRLLEGSDKATQLKYLNDISGF